MHALSLARADVARHGKARGVIVRVEEEARRVLRRGDPLVVVVDPKVFALVRERRPPVRDGVPRLPGDGESGALRAVEDGVVCREDVLGYDVGGQSGVLVRAYCVALGSVGILRVEELCVGGAVDVAGVSADSGCVASKLVYV